MKILSTRSAICFIALILFLGSVQHTHAQQSLMQIDTDRLYLVDKHIVQNQGLIVVSDHALEEAGLTLHQVGFRKDSYSGKTELIIQFKGKTGFVTDLGINLFGNDRETIWQDSIVRTDQPQEHNIINMIVRTPLTELKINSELHLWARSPIKKLPYEMWEWMDIGPSEWLTLAEDSLSVTPETESIDIDSSLTYNEQDITNKPLFNYNGESELQYIERNIKYPAKAKKKEIHGVVMVMFTVTPNGSIKDAEIAKDIGGGCGKAVLKVIKSMPPWTPGTVDGNAVPVRVTRPVRFKL